MRYFLIFLFALLTACGSAAPSVKPFKMDIQQGNVVTSKMLLQLRPGMTKSQVKFIMGTPLIVDSFHKDRWDYFYQMRQAGKITEQRRVILDFDKDLLTKVRGDVVPEGTAGAAKGDESSVAKTITVEPKPKQDEGMLDKLKFWKSDENAAAVKPEAAKPKTVDKPTEEKSWTEKLKFWKKDETATTAKPAEKSIAETPAPQANSDAPAGDASIDMPSVLAVPISGVLVPDVPAVETPALETPSVKAPVEMTPVTEEPVVIAPVVEAPPVEMAKPVELPKAQLTKDQLPKVQPPKPEAPKVAAPALVKMPTTKADERLIFRMDRNLDLKNLQAPISVAPSDITPRDVSKSAPAPAINAPAEVKAKANKIEQPVPVEESPGYFERMLEKIGF